MNNRALPTETAASQELRLTKDLLRDIVTLVRQGKFGADLDEKLGRADNLLAEVRGTSRHTVDTTSSEGYDRSPRAQSNRRP